MRRGDIVTVATNGDYGKPRPAVVIQADALNETKLQSSIVALITSQIVEAPLLRIDLGNNERTGLKAKSQIMADKLVTIRKKQIGPKIGRLNSAELQRLNRTLAFVVGVGGGVKTA